MDIEDIRMYRENAKTTEEPEKPIDAVLGINIVRKILSMEVLANPCSITVSTDLYGVTISGHHTHILIPTCIPWDEWAKIEIFVRERSLLDGKVGIDG